MHTLLTSVIETRWNDASGWEGKEGGGNKTSERNLNAWTSSEFEADSLHSFSSLPCVVMKWHSLLFNLLPFWSPLLIWFGDIAKWGISFFQHSALSTWYLHEPSYCNDLTSFPYYHTWNVMTMTTTIHPHYSFIKTTPMAFNSLFHSNMETLHVEFYI
jgi:hypothetical protein